MECTAYYAMLSLSVIVLSTTSAWLSIMYNNTLSEHLTKRLDAKDAENSRIMHIMAKLRDSFNMLDDSDMIFLGLKPESESESDSEKWISGDDRKSD